VNLKHGVRISGVQPEIVLAIMVVESIHDEMGIPFTITSILDGKHGKNSFHYSGKAFDIRTWVDDSGTQYDHEFKLEIARRIRNALGEEFDVVVEPTHIHIELDVREQQLTLPV
jgi:hypothetical protein